MAKYYATSNKLQNLKVTLHTTVGPPLSKHLCIISFAKSNV